MAITPNAYALQERGGIRKEVVNEGDSAEGAKAMIVTSSRVAGLRYFNMIKEKLEFRHQLRFFLKLRKLKRRHGGKHKCCSRTT
jgi:hypothetical protein